MWSIPLVPKKKSQLKGYEKPTSETSSFPLFLLQKTAHYPLPTTPFTDRRGLAREVIIGPVNSRSGGRERRGRKRTAGFAHQSRSGSVANTLSPCREPQRRVLTLHNLNRLKTLRDLRGGCSRSTEETFEVVAALSSQKGGRMKRRKKMDGLLTSINKPVVVCRPTQTMNQYPSTRKTCSTENTDKS